MRSQINISWNKRLNPFGLSKRSRLSVGIIFLVILAILLIFEFIYYNSSLISATLFTMVAVFTGLTAIIRQKEQGPTSSPSTS
jgi:hypothetical protein